MNDHPFGTQPDPRKAQSSPLPLYIAVSLRYLQTGGLGEVMGLANQAKSIGAAKVQMDTDMAIALCHLAGQAGASEL